MKESRKQSIRNTLEIESKALLDLISNLDEGAIDQVIEGMLACKGKIITSGCGTSGEAAKKISHTLSCVECPSLFLAPSDASHGGMGVVQKEDMVVLISKGGGSEEIVSMIPIVKAKRALVVGVTENPDSPLAKESDIFLQIKVTKEADIFDMLATSSIIALIGVFDAIAIVLMKEKQYSKEQFALIHPSGAVGAKLKSQI